MKDDTKIHNADLEWERRVLCRDESCIGIIGPDGRCKECGLLNKASFSENGLESGDGTSDGLNEPNDLYEPEPLENDDSQIISDEEWAQRKLCEDESCIGTIGSDGRCKECGRLYRDEL
jgi:hypothetical protein